MEIVKLIYSVHNSRGVDEGVGDKPNFGVVEEDPPQSFHHIHTLGETLKRMFKEYANTRSKKQVLGILQDETFTYKKIAKASMQFLCLHEPAPHSHK